jgi:hypothetical protein
MHGKNSYVLEKDESEDGMGMSLPVKDADR